MKIEKPQNRAVSKTILLVFERLELLIIWLTLALIPVWAWPVWGAVNDSRNMLIFILVPFLFALEFTKAIYINRGVRLGFLGSRLNLVLCGPAALVFITWAVEGFRMQKFFGWGTPWFNSVLTVFLLLLWYFILRSYFDSHFKKVFKRFTWLLSIAMILALAINQAGNSHFDFDFLYSISWFFLLWTFLALSLSIAEIPFSKNSLKIDLGGLSYPVILAVLIAGYFYFSFSFNIVKAGSEFSRRRFQEAFKLNPDHPAYIISASKEKIDELVVRFNQDDPTVLKQEVAKVVADLAKLNSVVNDGELSLETARTYVKLSRLVEGSEVLAKNYYDIAVKTGAGSNTPDVLKEVLGFYRVNLRDFEQGLKLAQYAMSAYPEDSYFIIEKSLILEAMDKSEEALNLLKGKKGSNLEIEYHYGRILYNLEKFDASRDVFLDVLSKDPNYADANYSLGAYYHRNKEIRNALKYFEKVAELNQSNQDIAKKIQDIKSRLGQ